LYFLLISLKYNAKDCLCRLDHLPEERVDLVFPVSEVAALDKVVRLLAPAAGGGVQLEGPQKVGCVAEVGADGHDLVDEVLDADDAVTPELLLDQVVGGDGSPLAVNLDEPTLVDQLANGLQVRRTPGDVGFANPKHADGGLVELDEDSVVDLTQAEQLQDLLDLRRDLVDTTDAHHEGQLGLGRHIVAVVLLGLPLEPDLVALLLAVLLHVLLGALEHLLPLGVRGLLSGDGGLGSLGPGGGLPLAPLEDRLGDGGQLFVRHLAVVS